MSEQEQKDARDIAKGLLEHFDFAAQIAAKEEEFRGELRGILLSFVEVMDSFDRSFAAAQNQQATEKIDMPAEETVRLIRRQLESALQSAGVSPISSQGQRVQPGQHEIVGTREGDDIMEDLIVEELFRGYMWGDEVLRKPKVIVATRRHEGREAKQ